MSEEANNPVGRLHRILSQAAKRGDQEKVFQVWREILEIPEAGRSEVLFAVQEVVGLVQDAREAVERLGDGDGVGDAALYLRPFKNVEKVFWSTSLQQLWKGPKQLLIEANLDLLEVAADQVSVAAPESVLPPDELERLLGEVNELMQAVIDSDLPQDVKSVLLDQLDGIRRAILSYRIGGTDGLVASVERAWGAALARESLLIEFSESPALADFLRFLWKVGTLVELVDSTNRLTEGIRGLLQSG